MKSISVLYLRLASEWKDFIGGVHEMASAACPPVCFFVLGVDVFHDTLLRFGREGHSFFPILVLYCSGLHFVQSAGLLNA